MYKRKYIDVQKEVKQNTTRNRQTFKVKQETEYNDLDKSRPN